ncbi:class I SAM-dependent methyltransferase [Streptomyces sp. YIM B13518]|uniref:class I SAM-dependent methyltransferase n=1 Tax=Streptomyces sp. YIM B13518 TaxID=3366316 RepID=UPI00369DFE1C
MTATEADHVVATRTFYDAVAEDYAARFRDQLVVRPLDRALLAGFAELVGEGGRVADLGCGPGAVTAHLACLGLSVFGLDLSEGMLAIARREQPGLRFEQGSMRNLDLSDGALAGVVSWYSTIHTPQDELPAVYAEFRRVLAPGGHLLLAFQCGDEPRRHEHPWGHPVTLDFRRMRPGRIAPLLEAAGFTLVQQTVRAADTDQGESTPQALLIARATQ